MRSDNKGKDQLVCTEKLILACCLLLAVISPILHFNMFFQDAYISQQIFSLLFLNISFIYFLQKNKNKEFVLSFPYYILLLFSVVAIVIFLFNSLSILSVLCLYALCVLVFSSSDLWNSALLIVSYASVASAAHSIGIFVAYKLGIYVSFDGRMSGSYGQSNLLAALMLLGLFSYTQLLVTYRRRNFLYFSPLMLLGTVLFMTASRAAIIALCVSILFIMLSWRKGKLVKVKFYFLSLSLVIIASYFIAQFVGNWTPVSRVQDAWSVTGGAGTYLRLVYWLSAILMGCDHLLFGTGFGGYAKKLGDYAILSVEKLHLPYDYISQTLWAHNDFLQIFSEHGLIVFLLVLAFVCIVMIQCWKNISRANIFIFVGLTSFVCMMCFGHPFYYHNLVLMVCLMITPILGAWRGKRIIFTKKYIIPVITGIIIFVNIFSCLNFWQMYNLQQFRRYMVESKEPMTERFKNGQLLYLSGSVENPIYGWRFKHSLYLNLVRYLQEADNLDLGRYVLPDMIRYSQKNRFPSYLFTLAKLYYILGDYKNARKFASLAFERKPDVNEYFDLIHLCNVLLISKENNINIEKLISADHLLFLYERNILRPRQLNSFGVAL